MEKFQVDELSLPKQKPKNNQTVIGGNGNYDTVIVRETQVSQIPEITNKEMVIQMIVFYFTARVRPTETRTAPDFAS